MDGRKSNGGHSTKGKAGRKPKADELKLIEHMDSVLVPQEAWEALAELVTEKDVQAIRLWLSYRYGQPKQSIDIESQGEKITGFTLEVIHKNEA